MKKLLIPVLILLMLLSTAAHAEVVTAEPVYLDVTTIIHGDLIYYSGSVDGGEQGVYVMQADGNEVRLISSINASLVALSGSNLLVDYYDEEMEESRLAVLRPDGTLVELNEKYGGRAIAADGRFYWGMGSCAQDGSDVRRYFDSPIAEAYDYYPAAIHDGYMYYLDWSEMSEVVYAEGSGQPMGAALCRLNLTDLTVETISPLGTRFLGIEGDMIYYTRDNFWYEVDFGMESAEYEVDQGLFCADLSTLNEKRLASYPDDMSVVDSYLFIADGVVYGMHSDFTSDEVGISSILRIAADGTRLSDLPLTADTWSALCGVQDGILYIAQSAFTVTEDDFIQQDCIIAINLESGEQTTLNPDSMDMLFYSESDPAVVVVGGRVYFSAYDMERWALCLKSMNLDGSDLKLLAYGISYAEG